MANSPAPRFGRYELVERIAIGGMAELYRARLDGAHDFHKPVVIKKILPHLSADPNFVSMFIDEAKITAQLQHPKIVQVFELGTTGGELFIAMEFVDGIDLLKLLRFHARRGRRLPEQFAVYIAHELLDALEHAHSAEDSDGEPLHVVHRDVSPGNVLISKRGAVKLTDFGIARAAARNQKTEAGTLKGKYGYMSPEQVINAQVDGRSDLFAVGVVLTEMLMGKRLFSAPSDLDVLLMVRDVNLERLVRFGNHIEKGLLDIIRRALSGDPNERIQSAGDFRDELADWLFERRHRVTSKNISHLVSEVRAGGVLGLDQSAKGTPVVGGRHGPTPVTAVATPDSVPGAPQERAPEPASAPADAPMGDPEISWRPTTDRMASGSRRLDAVKPEDVGNARALDDVDSAYPLIDPDSAPLVDPGSGRLRAHGRGSTAGKFGRKPLMASGTQPFEDGRSHRSSANLGDALSEAAERAAFDRDLASSSQLAAAAVEDILSESSLPDIGDVELPGIGDLELAPSGAVELELDLGDPDIEISLGEDPALSLADGPEISLADGPEISLDDGPEISLADGPEISLAEPSGGRIPSQPFAPSEPVVALIEESIGDEPDDTDVVFAEPRPLDALPDRGELGHLTALALFANLVRRKVTGKLTLVLEPTHKEIYFIDGLPKYVSSNVASERLGEFLRQKGVISEGELSMALVMLPQFDNRLIATLVGLGLMDDSEAIHMVTQQVRAKLVDACGWEKGSYRFFEGEEIPYAWLPLPLDPFEVMGAAALTTSNEFIDGWAAWREERVPQRVAPAPVELDKFRMPDELKTLVRRINGTRTIAELHQESSGDEDWRRTCRLLLLLTECGVTRVLQT